MFRVGEVGGVLPKATNTGVLALSSWTDRSCMGSTEREREREGEREGGRERERCSTAVRGRVSL